MAGKFNYNDICADYLIDAIAQEQYDKAVKCIMDKYYQDINDALKTSLSNIGVSVEDLRQGDLIMIPNSVASYTDYFYKSTLLFRLHSRPDLVKFGSWKIEYFN